MKYTLLIGALLTTPFLVHAAETPWMVGEHVCDDTAVQEIVAQGQTVDCQIAATGKPGVCTVSGKCREAVHSVASNQPSSLEKVAVIVARKTNSIFTHVGDAMTSFMPAHGASSLSARPFGAQDEANQNATSTTTSERIRTMLCAPHTYAPSFVARLIPTYSMHSLCGNPSTEIKEFIVTSVNQKKSVREESNADTPHSGLFIIADPAVVSLGGRAEIRWGAAQVKPGTCVVSGPGMKERGNWGSAPTPAIFEAVSFTLTCAGLDGAEIRKSVQIDLGA